MIRQKILVVLGALSMSSGCVQTHPQVDTRAGDAVVAARGAQTLNPAGLNPDGVPGIDGRPAKETMDRYVESFRTPPPTTNIINIGGGLNETAGGR